MQLYCLLSLPNYLYWNFYLYSSISFSLISFSISCKADLLVMDSCSFYLLENVFMLPLLLKDSFAGYKVLQHFVFFLTTFCYPLFLTSSQLFILLGFPYPWLVNSLLLLSRFSFKFLTICPSVDFFVFIPTGVCQVFLMCTLVFCITFTHFSFFHSWYS